jgi:hypothetical protein
MPIEIIQQREAVDVEKYFAVYEWKNDRGGGFSFDCDKSGNVFPLTNPAAQENYDKCKSGEYDVEFVGVQDFSYTYWTPKIGKCSCGKEVELSHFTNTCDCGRDYNSGGWLLAPRSQWGEETGEHISDIMRIP